MADPAGNVLVQGFFHLVVSQISTRLITFFLNLLTARLLTIDAYGLASVQFHLINTFILFLSREGFRRGCLRAQQSCASKELVARNVLAIASLSIALGVPITLCTCGVALRGNGRWGDPYAHAIYLQGLAALVELLSEPLYILAQLRLRLQLRVFAEASATLARGVATLALLKLSVMDVGISLSVAQCIYAAVTLMVYVGGMAGELPWLSGKQTSCQRAALTGKEQGPATAEQHRPQHAALGAQPALESSRKAPASELPEPEAAEDENEDEGWELLGASASSDSSAQPVLPQQGGPVGSIQSLAPGRSTRPDLSNGQADAAGESGIAGDKSPCAKADLGGMSSQSGRHGRADRSSGGTHSGDVDMHAETEGRSLLYPRSASMAAEITGGLEDRPPGMADSRDQASHNHSPDEKVHDKVHGSKQQQDVAGPEAAAAAGFDRKEVLWRCTIFTVQAATKLLLAEGSKVVMVASQSTYSQGIYGLVSNLGSLVVRTIFQPFEEAAFLAFSQRESGMSRQAASRKQAQELSIAVRCVTLVGLLAVAFGPAYTYMLLRLVYGQLWSETEAPRALAVYCLYILLMAVNGILEAFVHAVANSRDIAYGNGWLVVCSLVHMGLAVVLVRSHGAVGLIAADAANMVLRIAFCLVFVARYFRGIRSFQLRDLFPSRAALSALAAASLICLTADSILFKGTALPKSLQEGAAQALRMVHASLEGMGFIPRAAMHVGVGASTLGALMLALYRSERSLLAGIRQLRKSAVS